MPKLSLLKLLIVPVFAEHDEDGTIVAEQAVEQPVAVYGFQGVEPFVAQLRHKLDEVNGDG